MFGIKQTETLRTPTGTPLGPQHPLFPWRGYDLFLASSWKRLGPWFCSASLEQRVGMNPPAQHTVRALLGLGAGVSAMGNHASKEEDMVVSVWRDMISFRGLSVSDDSLCTLLAWAKSHDFPVDLDAAFSPFLWEALGHWLAEEFSGGDFAVPRLMAVWRCLFCAIPALDSASEMGSSEGRDGANTLGGRSPDRATACFSLAPCGPAGGVGTPHGTCVSSGGYVLLTSPDPYFSGRSPSPPSATLMSPRAIAACRPHLGDGASLPASLSAPPSPAGWFSPFLRKAAGGSLRWPAQDPPLPHIASESGVSSGISGRHNNTGHFLVVSHGACAVVPDASIVNTFRQVSVPADVTPPAGFPLLFHGACKDNSDRDCHISAMSPNVMCPQD
ncbi:uncharacterized protein LOC121357997 [Pyrgilauda ruficollis]|uniref:uncharacterized protein LOC121357997 n=1 Tax=Pyrgilauda ruficollis TaxID=221976 RepID=UPI001B86E8C5|nr:uncharacterized protein LOC121357997 [Pyrgilauda ruficollis]